MTPDAVVADVPETPVRRGAGPGPRVIVLRDPGSDYRDGGEENVLQILEAASDLSSSSDELILAAYDWPTRYHLDPARANIVRSVDLPSNARVLEIGAGCGPITRYLGEQCALVDAVEPAPWRAEVAAARTRDLPNVRVFVGHLSDVPPEPAYDVVVVIGVLEYVGDGSADPAPYAQFLADVNTRLVGGGTLILAIENKLGVKYLVGAPEDHTGRVFDSVEGYPGGTHARTFSCAELRALATSSGLTPDVRPVFPDYKLTRVVFGEMPEAVRSLLYRIPHFPSADWLGRPRAKLADEMRLWREFGNARLEHDFGNSLLLLAGKGRPSPLWPAAVAARFFSVGRRARFSVETTVRVVADSVEFDRRPVLPADDGGGLRVRRGSHPYVDGEDLLEHIAANPDVDLRALLRGWRTILGESVDDKGEVPVDVVPHNLVLSGTGQLHVIDIEFDGGGYTLDQVLRRGIYWLAERLASASPPGRWPDAETVEDLMRAFGVLVELPADGSWIPGAVRVEATFQSQVAAGPAPNVSMEAWRDELAAELTRRLGLPVHERLQDDRLQEHLPYLVISSRARVAHLESASLRSSLDETQHALEASRARCAQFEGSRAARLVDSYRRGLERGLPTGSRRRRAYARIMRAVVHESTHVDGH